MKTVAALFALFTTVITSSAVVPIATGPIYNPANGHNYFLVNGNTWSVAQSVALTLGGNLVTINNAAENAWLKTNFLDPNPTINPWIGLHDIDNNGSWNWISGETVSYLNWAPGEPNFGSERVSNIYPSSHGWAGLWNNAPDVVQAGVLFGIVEVPEPSSLALGLISCLCVAVARNRRTT